MDDLRAVAAIAMVLFHAGVELAGGGLVGLDVFFVISGYLITAILVQDPSDGKARAGGRSRPLMHAPRPCVCSGTAEGRLSLQEASLRPRTAPRSPSAQPPRADRRAAAIFSLPQALNIDGCAAAFRLQGARMEQGQHEP
ncbi:hypothetical protein ABEG18_05605 [Alsobacter sp. KACC 23698]|uniref:Acyltransferase n=1 Tax=Alsobacter sp. KACC 23698 TaxID=3149229 RepID=A0AAU7JIZ2_9HYPH